MNSARECGRSYCEPPNGAVGYWNIRSLKSADAEDEAVSGHVSQNNVRHGEDAGDQEDNSWAVCWPGINILKLWNCQNEWFIGYILFLESLHSSKYLHSSECLGQRHQTCAAVLIGRIQCSDECQRSYTQRQQARKVG